VRWIGVGRIVASTAAVPAVVVLAYWLVKPPAATTESKLPYASNTSANQPRDTAADATAPTTTAPTTTAQASVVVVHVAGSVNVPGVYRLVAGSRVIDAVQAAGGLANEANPDAVNLAALVADGQRVYVPAVGESISTVAADIAVVEEAAELWPIDINSANADRLEDLPGVGPATASAIIAHRDLHGPFASVEQLADVRGIGPAKLEAIRSLVVV
jgi:competence protein ComEA